MPRSFAAAVLLGTLLAACSPTFNWREVRVEPSSLQAMLPCKPDRASRRLPIGDREVEMSVLGCDTGGTTYAILTADLGEPARARDALEQWNRASLAQLRGGATATHPFVPPGALALDTSVRVSSKGQRTDGSAVRGEAAYFAHGSRIFQAVVFATDPGPAVLQPFFDGLRFP